MRKRGARVTELLHGECLLFLKWFEDESVDAVVTDPPYGLAFMNKHWDYDVPSVELWREVLRVLKPGGHVLSFGGTRTYHRMVVNIEDAGFEIRDQIMWIYGSGFPKSHDVSKGIDKAAGATREIVGPKVYANGSKTRVTGGQGEKFVVRGENSGETAPATDAAKQWQGWGTALKPANEPIVLARKPLVGTVAENVQTFGTGALNIDASRIGTEQVEKGRAGRQADQFSKNAYANGQGYAGHNAEAGFSTGRWPANVLFDEEAAAVLDAQSGNRPGFSGGGTKGAGFRSEYVNGENKNKTLPAQTYNDSGGASRFFYVAKASKRERGEGNAHPTVKPIKLIEYLVRMITPPGGVVLDPFMGSGTTGVACKNLGFRFIGIEREKEYVKIAKRRIEAHA